MTEFATIAAALTARHNADVSLCYHDSTDCWDLGFECPRGALVAEEFKVDGYDAELVLSLGDCYEEELKDGQKVAAQIYIAWLDTEADDFVTAELLTGITPDMALLIIKGLGTETTREFLVRLGFDIAN